MSEMTLGPRFAAQVGGYPISLKSLLDGPPAIERGIIFVLVMRAQGPVPIKFTRIPSLLHHAWKIRSTLSEWDTAWFEEGYKATSRSPGPCPSQVEVVPALLSQYRLS